MCAVLPMHNPVLNYAWGSRTLLSRFLGRTGPSSDPEAELWMGAHPTAPSEVWIDGRWRKLDKVVANAAHALLGTESINRFGPQVPFLFKVLAVAQPLSLQVHPNRVQARAGFAREEANGLSLQAPERNYKDPNSKPECLCALEPFWGLCGFRSPEEIADWFTRLAPKALRAEVEVLSSDRDEVALESMLESLLKMSTERREKVLAEVQSSLALRCSDRKEDPAYWLQVLLDAYPDDIGVLAAVFLRLMHLKPGQAVFLPAGHLHAYLEGLGLEIMANSDNVLRAGLTPKHVDTGELLRILDFDSRPQRIMEKRPGPEGLRTYPSLAEEFALSVVEAETGSPRTVHTSGGMEILLCTAGEVGIAADGSGEEQQLAQGQSVCIPAQVAEFTCSGKGTVYRASIGI